MRSVRNELLVALALAVGLFLLSRTKQGQQAVSGAADAVASAIIGIRLNNPLNVERGEQWEGLAPVQLHERFATFVSVPYGIRAAARILLTYQRSYGINTVRGFIDRWNPKSDGQPATYIPNVSAGLGVGPDTRIDVTKRATAFALVRGMVKQEVGAVAALLVSDADVLQGLTLAGVA